MVSLRELLKNIEESEQEKQADTKPMITIEDLRHTSKSLEKLASPDREVDVMAKLAVLFDMGLEKNSEHILNKARKMLWASKDEIKAEEMFAQAAKNRKRAERIRKGKTLGDYKWPVVGTAGAIGAYYLGTKTPEKNKKEELRAVAKKYFSLGRQSAGGAQ